MLYQICPRCKFRVALNKHICSTCGAAVPCKKELEEAALQKEQEMQAARGQKGFWKSLFSPAQARAEKSEPIHEERALGKT